ncbi:hypothetical protein AB1Y20_006850 [Prymnesium parvum]|uniref:Uncharacterized protein n=1 Tax=Prymnesium parvum TaxID=97485 RepID=A0AB34J2Z1_PRYPA
MPSTLALAFLLLPALSHGFSTPFPRRSCLAGQHTILSSRTHADARLGHTDPSRRRGEPPTDGIAKLSAARRQRSGANAHGGAQPTCARRRRPRAGGRAAAAAMAAEPGGPLRAAEKLYVRAAPFIYYGAYVAFFGKMVLVLVERATG